MKRVLGILLSPVILMGIVAGPTALAIDQDEKTSASLGAATACAGHTFGTFSGVSACINEQGELHICGNNFPDEKFRNYISGLAGAEDGYFSGEECAAVTYINVAYQGIGTLQGIEFFTDLTQLICCINRLTQLNVNSNTLLNGLKCSHNKLTHLNVSSNTALTNLECGNNQLTHLNVSKNTALTDSWCRDNQLSALDLSKNTMLCHGSISVNGQSKTLTEDATNGRITVDLGKILSKDSFDKVIDVSAGEWNPDTGTVTFAAKPDSFTYTYDTGNSDYPMEVTVYVESSQTVTINGESLDCTPRQEIPLTANGFYTANGCAGWRGDTDTITDVSGSSTTLTVPDRNMTIEAEYILIGDIDENGDITPADALLIARLSVQNIPSISVGDIDGNGIVTSADVVYMKRYLVGIFTPSK